MARAGRPVSLSATIDRLRGASLPDRIPRIAIVTRDAPPRHCGVGDHSIRLAEALAEQGAQVRVFAFDGTADATVATGSATDAVAWLAWVEAELRKHPVDHVVLQYTPLYYQDIPGWADGQLTRWWARLARSFATALVVHETYYRSIRQPTSLVSGTRQKRTLEALARASAHVFSASDPLVREMRRWGLRRTPVLLPIGSNLPVVLAERERVRRRHGVEPNALVLTLFGGGNSLKWMAGHVNAVSRDLSARHITHRWLLLGGVPAEWFALSLPPIAPGRLSPAELSAHLAMTDLFLMPHAAGICAKRGTLMAAMQHGLAVVGTRGPMTDPFWDSVPGVQVTPAAEAEFVTAVVRLAGNAVLRAEMGAQNDRHYRAHFDWPHIARALLATIAPTPIEASPTLDGPVASI